MPDTEGPTGAGTPTGATPPTEPTRPTASTGSTAPAGPAAPAEPTRPPGPSAAAESGDGRPVADQVTDEFLAHRELLFSMVYNILGSAADTEDVLQDSWLAWSARRHRRDAEPIANVRAYLVRVAVQHALSRRAGISRRKEQYIGPWLPEPLVTEASAGDPDAPATAAAPGDAAEPVLQAEAVSMALLVVLEALTPLERAVFVLHDVFGYRHTEIAGILDRTPAAVRRLSSRAREHVQDGRPRFPVAPQVRRAATERFLAAAVGGDLDALLQVLAPDVVLWTDGGGRVRHPKRPIHGRDKVARFFVGISDTVPATAEVHWRTVNGQSAAVLSDGGTTFAVVLVEPAPDRERVSGLYVIVNPEKLTRVG